MAKRKQPELGFIPWERDLYGKYFLPFGKWQVPCNEKGELQAVHHWDIPQGKS